MIRRLNIFRITFAALLFAFSGGVWFLHDALAATGQMYLTPATVSVEQDKTFSVALRLDPGTTVDGVQATITYDASKLQYVNIDTSASAFPVQLQQATGSGSVTIARGHLAGGVSGDMLVASVTFKAVTGSGSTSLGLSNVNASSGGTYTGPSAIGSTVSFTTPPSSSSGSSGSGSSGSNQDSSSGNSQSSGSSSGNSSGGSNSSPKSSGSSGSSNKSSGSGSSGGPSSSSSNNPEAVGDSGVTITERTVQFTRASFNLQADRPVQAYIKYGLGNALNLTTPPSDFKTDHEIALDPGTLVPGELYSYVIVVKNEQGKVTETPVQTVRTKGFTVRVAVLGKDRQPLKNHRITLHSDAKTTISDSKGFARFTDVSPGEHRVEATINRKVYGQPVAVDNDIQVAGDQQSADMQNVSVVYEATPNTSPWPMIIVTFFSVALVVSVIFLKVRHIDGGSHFSFQSSHGNTYPTAPTPTVVGTPQPHRTIRQSPSPPEQPSVTIDSIPYPTQAAPGSTITPTSKEDQELPR